MGGEGYGEKSAETSLIFSRCPHNIFEISL